MTEPTRLSLVIAKAASLTTDDARAAEIERSNRVADALKRRNEAADRIDGEGVPLTPDVAGAIRAGRLPPIRTEALTIMREWMASDDAQPILVLSGGTGRGKGVAASWAFATGPERCAWVTKSELLRVSTAYFGAGADRWEKLLGCQLLVLDDIGTEKEHESERMESALVDIFEERKRHVRATRTIITTNMSERAWCARYRDPRLHSRMRMSVTYQVCGGPDLRGVR